MRLSSIDLSWALMFGHFLSLGCSFVVTTPRHPTTPQRIAQKLWMADKAAPNVSGEDLEKMLTEWDQPLVVDAYATWCGPCLLMAPEFEKAAQELKGRVRFVKLDSDQEEAMAARLNIMGLPTLLFLDQHKSDKDEAPKAVLKGRIEGALEKQSIVDLCEHHFFEGPKPQLPF